MTHRKKGFTLIELLVVIAIIALLVAIVVPALGKAKIYAQKVVCRSNIRQQAMGVMLYSEENDTWVPTIDTGNWLWDLAFWSTNQISNYAGFDNNEIYYCPANRLKSADDARFWQFSWVYSWGVPLDQGPVPIRDENVPSCDQFAEFRVMPTLYMFDKIDTNGNSTLPATLVSGRPGKWISKLSEVKAASATTMLMDNVISESDRENFFEIDDGGIGSDFNTFDNSNHATRHKFPGTNYLKPDGANIGYADGHVDWRDFEDMEVQVNNGVLFWW